MWYDSRRKVYFAVGMFILSLLISLPAQGEPSFDLHDDLIAHGALENSGIIDKLPLQVSNQKRQIIIDDKVYLFNGNCIYRNQQGRQVGLSSFKEGMQVGFYVLDKVSITKIWHAGESIDQEKSEVAPTTNNSDGNNKIHLENGVWKN